MSDLERRFSSLHEKLSQSTHRNWQLSEADRRLLSQWAFKTALVLSATAQPAFAAVPSQHAAEFYKNERLAFPSSFIIISAQSRESISGFRFSFCSTWMFESQAYSADAIKSVHDGAYKVYLHLGYLMILVCHVPSQHVEFLVDNRIAVAVVSTAPRVDLAPGLPTNLPEEFRFAMSVGARLL
jgi:hypothetical protein